MVIIIKQLKNSLRKIGIAIKIAYLQKCHHLLCTYLSNRRFSLYKVEVRNQNNNKNNNKARNHSKFLINFTAFVYDLTSVTSVNSI